ncbi:hypothetical protein ACH33_08530 [Aneurinibacillus sp. XH2]|uniref:hypothetical protein n=1 Tax=Aneurinibacillus sp. XH2 TaxID=1450761 RepID=UPI0007110E7E|nr:hypothetical protein [Aneurinibacillus sp. XH2]AMA72898.1 hypothetical protein ACH33_08530 [Aneurinibacillus sp. XH2]
MDNAKAIGNKIADACIANANSGIEPAEIKKRNCELIREEINRIPIDELVDYFEDAILVKSELALKITFSFPLKFKDLT